MKGIKSNLKKEKIRRIATIASVSLYGVTAAPTLVYATDGQIQGMSNLKQLALGAVAAIGFIPLIKGIMSLGTAISQRDSQGMAMAAAEIAGGAIMVGASGILTYLGITAG